MTVNQVKLLIGVLTGLFVLGSCGESWSWVVSLAWDANQEGDLDGYRLYYGSSPGGEDYTLPIQDIQESETSTTTSVGDGVHCWTLTAYDLSDNESDPSHEVCIDLPGGDIYPPMPPGGFIIDGVM